MTCICLNHPKHQVIIRGVRPDHQRGYCFPLSQHLSQTTNVFQLPACRASMSPWALWLTHATFLQCFCHSLLDFCHAQIWYPSSGGNVHHLSHLLAAQAAHAPYGSPSFPISQCRRTSRGRELMGRLLILIFQRSGTHCCSPGSPFQCRDAFTAVPGCERPVCGLIWRRQKRLCLKSVPLLLLRSLSANATGFARLLASMLG